MKSVIAFASASNLEKHLHYTTLSTKNQDFTPTLHIFQVNQTRISRYSFYLQHRFLPIRLTISLKLFKVCLCLRSGVVTLARIARVRRIDLCYSYNVHKSIIEKLVFNNFYKKDSIEHYKNYLMMLFSNVLFAILLNNLCP